MAGLPPTSPLAVFPNPFAETNVKMLQDLKKRTFSSTGSKFETVTDRVGRNYSPYSLGLSMRVLEDRKTAMATNEKGPGLPTESGPLGSRGGASAMPGKPMGSPVGGSAGGSVIGSALGGLGALMGSPGKGAVASAFPKPQTTIVVPRKSTARLTPLKSPTHGGQQAIDPVTGQPMADSDLPLASVHADTARAAQAFEAMIQRQYTFATDEDRDMALQRELSAYYQTAQRIAPDHTLPEHRPEWEDGIIARLAASARGGGPGRRWRDPSLVIPPFLLDKFGALSFVPPPPSVPPAQLVEACFNEVGRQYLDANKTAILDYLLKSPVKEHHQGLTLHLVDCLRYVPQPMKTRQDCDVSYTSVPASAVRLARELRTCEPVTLQLLDLVNAPRSLPQASPAAGQTGGGAGTNVSPALTSISAGLYTPHGAVSSPAPSSYAAVSLTPFTSPEFGKAMPLTLEEFSMLAEQQTERALGVLRGQWHKEAAELVASFVLDVEELRTRQYGGPGSGVVDPDPVVPLVIGDSQVSDFLRSAVALMRGQLWALGMARGQEYPREEDALAGVPFGATTNTATGVGGLHPHQQQYLHDMNNNGGGASPLAMPLSPLTPGNAGHTPGVNGRITLPALRMGEIGSPGGQSAFSPAKTGGSSHNPHGGEAFGMGHQHHQHSNNNQHHHHLALPHHPQPTVSTQSLHAQQQAMVAMALATDPAALGVAAEDVEEKDAVTAAFFRRPGEAAAFALVPAGSSLGASGFGGKAVSPSKTGTKGTFGSPSSPRSPGSPGSPSSPKSPSRFAGPSSYALSVLPNVAARQSLPTPQELAQLSPQDLLFLAGRLLAGMETKHMVIAKRLTKTFQAVATHMSAYLRQAVYRGIADFVGLMTKYSLSYEPHHQDQHEHGQEGHDGSRPGTGPSTALAIRARGNKASAGAHQLRSGSFSFAHNRNELALECEGLDDPLKWAIGNVNKDVNKPLVDFTGDSCKVLKEQPPPLIRMNMSIVFGQGGASFGCDFAEHMVAIHEKAQAEAAQAAREAAAAAAASGGGGRTGSNAASKRAKADAPAGGRRNSNAAEADANAAANAHGDGSKPGTASGSRATDAQAAARAALEQAADEIPTPKQPVVGEDLSRLWAGEVDFAYEPSFDAVQNALMRNLEALVASCTSFPRVEADIAAASGITAGLSGGASQAGNNNAAVGIEGSKSHSKANASGIPGAGGSGNSLLDVMIAQGNLSSVGLDDLAVRQAKNLITKVIMKSRVAPEELLARFESFSYLFAPNEKARLLALLNSPTSTLNDHVEELRRYEQVIADVDAVCDNIVVFPLVAISAAPLKDALKARARLLGTLVMRHIKVKALHGAELMCSMYTKMSKRLLFKPSTSEELVALHEVNNKLDMDMNALQAMMFGPGNGSITELIKLLYNEGVPREFQRSAAGGTIATGPAIPGGAAPAAPVSSPAAPHSAHSLVSPARSGGAFSAGNSRSGTRGALADAHNEVDIAAAAAAASAASLQVAVSAGLLSEFEGLPFTRAQCSIFKDALTWPEKVRGDQLVCQAVLDAERATLVDKLNFRMQAFVRDLDDTINVLDRLMNEGAMNRVTQVTATIRNLITRLETASNEAESINVQQGMLEQPVVDYVKEIKEAQERLQPFERLWQAVGTYLDSTRKWYDAPLLENNPDEAIKDAEAQRMIAAKILKEIPDEAGPPRQLISKVKEDLEHFINTDHALLALLANPGLKDRHWTAMEGAVGFDLPHAPDSSLSDMLELKLDQHVGQIEEFCVNASKEYSLERALDRMEGEWGPVTLELKSHAASGTYILSGASGEEVQALLDDHVVKSTTMAASRFAKPLEGRIKDWVSALTEIQAVLDVWLKVQSTWLYLSPIFSSEDIMHQMPTEGSRFTQVDGTWRNLMKGAVSDPRALQALRQPGMLDSLTECHALLELVQKGLSDYLEAKRLVFPRFFFLSNDELLEILSETKDPLRVQPHLRKCFEGVNALQFDPQGCITAMVSVEGEVVQMTPNPETGKFINPADAKGSVELWLLQVEAAMKRSCAAVVDNSITSYASAPSRSKWTLEWPAQAVLATTQTYWTQDVEAALRNTENKEALADYAKKCTAQIEDIIMLVRSKLPKLARTTLGALVVLDVHARDVTDHMVSVGVHSPIDFEWNSQLRYYWKTGGESAISGKPGTLKMCMINASLLYGYEYLGNSSRLVITPLTDRCYRTLMGALHLGLGGAPQGPAGTGKTESVKDLSKAAAFFCVVFNCSDGLDYLAMAKFFKGLAAAGAWSCFDEFNRIELEVLSVIAQQVLTIQQAVREGKKQFLFEGTMLNLLPSCATFITMNPGYAGRSELPDNLKSLFRDVAMMVPDYRMISEIILFSSGYLDARPLAGKIVATYKLCSEQLSSQDHYDYGMRAVVAVLRAAGNLKRSEGDLPEDVLVLRSIVDVNLPKFLQPDVPLFNAIVKDLFPGVVVPPPDRGSLMTAMHQACFELEVQPVPNILEKVLQIYEMMIVRHGFMLVGQPMSGKTISAKVLQSAMRRLHEQDPSDPRWANIHFVGINPKAISSGALYGRFDDLTHEWADGVLAVKFRDCAQNKIGTERDRKWIVFDGPVDAVWIENMNTVLDDNKKLCLTSGEIIAMSETTSMVFEVGDLAAASPATVSRCGMIYMEPQNLGWRPLVVSWLDHLMEDNPRYPFKPAHPSNPEARARQEKEERAAFEAAERLAAMEAALKAGSGEQHHGGGKKKGGGMAVDKRTYTIDAAARAQLLALFEWFVDPVLVLIRRQPLAEYCPTQDGMLISTMISVFDSLLHQFITTAPAPAGVPENFLSPTAGQGFNVGSVKVNGRVEPTTTDFESIFLFSLMWSVGATVNDAGRVALSEFVSEAAANASFLAKHPLAAFFGVKGWHACGTPGFAEACSHPAKDATGESIGPALPRTAYDRAEAALALPMPAGGGGKTLYDFFYVAQDGRWRDWTLALPKVPIPPTASYSDIIVSTPASVQFDYLVQLLMEQKHHVLVCGPTGTGKSTYMKRMLLETLPKDKFMPVFVAFSARTSAAATQAMVDVKLDKRRKGIYGPPPNQTCVVFVDDLNLPEPEKWGAMPPLELLRQMADSHGWYDLTENEFKTIEDTCIAAAMGPPGGGRSHVPSRLLRHFKLLCFTEVSDSTLSQIFGTVMDWFFTTKQQNGNARFSGDVARLGNIAVSATLDLYKASIGGLRPTPAKSHYTFNLRDFSRVVEGVFLATPDSVTTAQGFARLWLHEATRVFYDRLVDDNDRAWLLGQLKELTRKHYGHEMNNLCGNLVTMAAEAGDPSAAAAVAAGAKPGTVDLTIEHLRNLLYFDYGQPPQGGKQNPNEGPVLRGYSEVPAIGQLADKLDLALQEHNGMSKKPMDLVMFLFFMEHVVRVSRILKMPGGHALLVGVGGSGRRCATRLAAFLSEYNVLEIELAKSYGNIEWREDLKRIIKEAGTGLQPVVFAFADTQLKWEGMLEDVNAILNSGEVPGLFALEERAEILEKVAPIAKNAGLGRDLGQAELYAYFVSRVKKNLHVVLCMSPVGDAFRDRLRRFPSLVNCCTIDWYTSWPKDALSAVALKALQSMSMNDDTLNRVVDACQHFHRSTYELSSDFAAQRRRYNYVTPTSYLELLSTFRRFLDVKRKDVQSARQRYVVGLEKLDFATVQVNEMQKELEALQPNLKLSQQETAELMKVIEARLPGVEETRAVVSKDAAIASAEAEKVGAVKKECEDDLAVAMPALEAALKALDTISQADISSVKTMQKPPENVRMVMGAVCVMLGEKPEKVADPAGGSKKIDDYWVPAKKVLGDMKFIERLKTYDLNNIDPKRLDSVRAQFLSNENFKPEIVAKSSGAAEGLCRWVMAMDVYERVAKDVAPKKAALAEAEASLAITMGELNKKKATLKAVEDELATLQKQLDGANKKKEELAAQVDLCSKKLVRAEQLISGLGGEKTRWAQMSEELLAKSNAITGDVLLASGMIAYLGAFTAEYRKRGTDDWVRKCAELGIQTSASNSIAAAAAAAADGSAPASAAAHTYNLASTMGDPLVIRAWQMDGLPTDNYSTESAIICSCSRRWPLMIDPQSQANVWVRRTESKNKLLILKQSDQNFLRSLENAIQFGRPVLLENVGEELDPSLEPILLRVVFKQGGVQVINLGGTLVEFDDRFKLYITSKLPNPHYLPEVSTKVTLVNFLITPEGLADQLLGTVVAQERPDLQEQKNALIVQSAENQRQLKEIENRILHVLSSSSGNILEDETAINVLNSSKVLSNEISEKQRIAQETEAAIDVARAGYTPVADHASRLFFCIAGLNTIEPMYQYSLDWFVRLFLASIANSAKSDTLSERITSLNDHFTYSIYRNVCRSLFEKDKLLFSFLLTIGIMNGKGEVNSDEYFFLATGGVAGKDNVHPNPAPSWLSDKSWGEIVRASDSIPALAGLHTSMASPTALPLWEAWYRNDNPHKERLPQHWGEPGALSGMQKLLVLRCLRPDKLVLGIQDFIVNQLGSQFISPPPFDLKSCYEDSAPGQPLVFVLSPGSDPMAALMYFAESQGFKVFAISLGQGQGPIAESMVEKARQSGGWVVLQNCHLAVSWMPRLETMSETLAAAPVTDIAVNADGTLTDTTGTITNPKHLKQPPADAVHRNFRLWLTSYPSASFPVSILQNGVKMTNEPPRGMRENIKRSYLSDPISDPSFYNSVKNAEAFRKLLYALCFFHALVQERRGFGSLGFNIPYQFTESDLRISARQLAMFVDDEELTGALAAAEGGAVKTTAEAVPWKHLTYLTGECNYGGRVTDDMDRRGLMSLLGMVYNPKTLEPGSSLSSSSEEFLMPSAASGVNDYDSYCAYIDTLPTNAGCGTFGLHDNAAITRDIQTAYETLDAALLMASSVTYKTAGAEEESSGGDEGKKEEEEGKAGGGHKAKTRDETILELASDIYAKLPQDFDLEGVEMRFPNDPSQSMNTVLIQELARYNRLLQVIRSSMKDVQAAMKGLIVLSSSLEAVATDLSLGKVPALWKGRSYPSRKPLASYVSDLMKRLEMFTSWIDSGKTPPHFWLPGFYFTQSFMTGVAQVFARRYVIPIDQLTFDIKMMPTKPEDVNTLQPPADGAHIHGLFLDGCQWDYANACLGESAPAVLFAPAPVMWLLPVKIAELRQFPHYRSPIYRTTERRGVLSTTGHSTNFVTVARLPSNKPEDHWIRRGVAMVLSLDD